MTLRQCLRALLVTTTHSCQALNPPLAAAVQPSCSFSSSSASRVSQRCGSLEMLHGAVAMGHNIIPEPAGVQLADEPVLKELFPFSWNISQFRGRRIGERGLIVHYLPQVGRLARLISMCVGDLAASALKNARSAYARMICSYIESIHILYISG